MNVETPRERSVMFKINHAILHVLDFTSCVNVFSEDELDLSNKDVKSYVTRIARHALSGIDNKHGEFSDDSGFAQELQSYLRGQASFTDLSRQIAQFLADEFNRMESPTSCDVLVVDFEDEPKPPAVSDEADDDETAQAALAAAYAARAVRCFGILLLESKPAFMHEVGRASDGVVCNSIERHHAILPSPSQKMASYALVDVRTMQIQFVDKVRTVAGEERMVLPDGLLQCSVEASSKEVLDTTMRLVEQVADEYGANSAQAVARAKAYVSDPSRESDEVPFDEFADEVFTDDAPRQRLEQVAQEESIPERVRMEQSIAQRVAKRHKIRTDTGIEISFPAEYSQTPEFIEFTSAPNGLIQIELKNIGSIENR